MKRIRRICGVGRELVDGWMKDENREKYNDE